MPRLFFIIIESIFVQGTYPGTWLDWQTRIRTQNIYKIIILGFFTVGGCLDLEISILYFKKGVAVD